MKNKLVFVLVVLLAVSASGFAQGFEIGGSVFIATAGDVSVFGGGLNIAGTVYFTDIIGYGVYGNIMYGNYEGISIIPVALLMGPAFMLVNNDKFALPVAVGLHLQRTFGFGSVEDTIVAVEAFDVGVGANVTAEFRLNARMRLYGRLQFTYGFLGGGEFTIIPSIGIGF